MCKPRCKPCAVYFCTRPRQARLCKRATFSKTQLSNDLSEKRLRNGPPVAHTHFTHPKNADLITSVVDSQMTSTLRVCMCSSRPSDTCSSASTCTPWSCSRGSAQGYYAASDSSRCFHPPATACARGSRRRLVAAGSAQHSPSCSAWHRLDCSCSRLFVELAQQCSEFARVGRELLPSQVGWPTEVLAVAAVCSSLVVEVHTHCCIRSSVAPLKVVGLHSPAGGWQGCS